MPNRVRLLVVRDQDRAELERRARSKAEPARVAQRARIVLLSEQGLSGPAIAETVGCAEPTVVLWRKRYAERGLAGLDDAPRPGGPVRVMTAQVQAQVLADTVTPERVRWSVYKIPTLMGVHSDHDRRSTAGCSAGSAAVGAGHGAAGDQRDDERGAA